MIRLNDYFQLSRLSFLIFYFQNFFSKFYHNILLKEVDKTSQNNHASNILKISIYFQSQAFLLSLV